VITLNLGLIIKGYRRKKQLTQESLSHGICSVSHLSKIENGHKEAYKDTINLLLQRLEINIVDVEKDTILFTAMIEDFYKFIVYQDKENAKRKHQLLSESFENLSLIGMDLLFEIIEFRYYLLIGDRTSYKPKQKKLARKQSKFSQHENILFTYFHAIYYLYEGNLAKAQESLSLITDEVFNHYGDYYYHLSLTMSMANNSGAAILYGNKALEHFETYNNFIRKIHTQMILAINYYRIGALQDSERHYKLLLEHATRLADYQTITQTTHNLSLLKRKQGEYDEAISLLKKSIMLSKENRTSYLISISQLVESYLEAGYKSLALEIMPEVIELSKVEKNLQKAVKYQFKYHFFSTDIKEFAETHQDFKELEKNELFDDIISYSSALVDYYHDKQEQHHKMHYLELSNIALKKKITQLTGGIK
jgi:tetratricopeptide (TPR) repeat protein